MPQHATLSLLAHAALEHEDMAMMANFEVV